jgi:glycyl-tRNA synthetase beta chain
LARYKRASNIVKAEEKKDTCLYEKMVVANDLTTEYERTLLNALLSFKKSDDDFSQTLGELTGLNPMIAAFFDNLIVNDADAHIRLNRLNLLGSFRLLCDSVCEFSKIEG